MQKARKQGYYALTMLATLMIAVAACAQTSFGANPALPSAIISYTNGNGAATVPLPAMSGMANMTVTAVHIGARNHNAIQTHGQLGAKGNFF